MFTFKAFKIWYSDTQVVGYTQEDWDNAPAEDVQVVVVFYEEEVALGIHFSDAYMGMDEYSFNGKKVYAKEYSKESGSYGNRLYGTKKLGAYMSDEDYRNIMHVAVNDEPAEIYAEATVTSKVSKADVGPVQKGLNRKAA